MHPNRGDEARSTADECAEAPLSDYQSWINPVFLELSEIPAKDKTI
jgi:hypothetical protein